MNPLIFVALLQPIMQPTVNFVDSNDDSNVTYIIVNTKKGTCQVAVLKSKLKDMDKVVELVTKKCGL